MGRLNDKVAIITGASMGMGAEAVKLFAREGAKVAAVARSRDKLNAVVKSVVDEGFEAYAIVADVTSERDWDHIIDTVISAYGKIDILVNNAGACPPNNGLEECTEEMWNSLMNVNVKAQWYGMRAVAPHMRAIGGGSIVNCASGIVSQGGNDAVAYAASKGGVHSITKNVAVTLAHDHIRCNAVYPGFIYTPLIEKLGLNSFEMVSEMMSGKTPLPPYVGTPEDIAYAYLYLASDESKWVTGAEIYVDGGAMLV